MKKELTNKSEIKLVGLSARTNNKNEMDPLASKIGNLAGQFWSQRIADQVPNRKNPGTTFSVYTEYESDEHGDYTYFIENIAPEFQKLTIPPSKYQKFTTATGKMPEVVINSWQEIWKMTANDFAGNRAYQADFEVYDERARDPLNTSLDIYIGIK